MTRAYCQYTWGMRGLSGVTASKVGREGLAKDDMASLESRDQNKGCS